MSLMDDLGLSIFKASQYFSSIYVKENLNFVIDNEGQNQFDLIVWESFEIFPDFSERERWAFLVQQIFPHFGSISFANIQIIFDFLIE